MASPPVKVVDWSHCGSTTQPGSVAVGPSGEIAISFRYEEEPVLKILRFSRRGRLETGFGEGGVVTIRDFRPA